MNDDLTLLASTYLDGEATPDERARVEADPSLLDEVERLRAARAALLDTRWFERPGDDVREATIAAALTAWDASATDLTSSTTGSRPVRRSHVTSFERRRMYTRVLSVAAAVVAVAAFGVVIAQFDSGGGDNEDSAATEAAADTQARSETGDLTEQIAPDETASAVFSGDDAPDDAGGADSDVGASTEAAPSADAATEATEAPAGTVPLAATSPAPRANLTTADELGTFAADAKAAAEDDGNRDTLAAPCPGPTFDDIDEYIATVTYRDRLVLVGIDADRERAIAVDPETCEIVAEAPLP